MGMPKLALPFGPESMLERVVRLLSQAVHPIVVVAAPSQELPKLPRDILVARDRREGRGPLEGLLAGLTALPTDADAAFATSCDVPQLVPQFVTRTIELLEDYDIAVPECQGFTHPLAAVYRRTVVGRIESLLAADRLRPAYLFEAVRTRRISAEELTDVDPSLTTLLNLNQPEEYLHALAACGFAPPEDLLTALRNFRGFSEN
jgi:molybdopterin-guanine dinucleotide biosynthesis protein A